MKRIHTSFKPWQTGLAALAMLLGTGLAAADSPAAPPQQDRVVAESASRHVPAPVPSVRLAEPIRLAWDRVGSMA